MSQLTVNMDELEGDIKNDLIVTVFLQDADGTTQMEGSVQGRVSFGSTNNEFTMVDDGTGGDETAGMGPNWYKFYKSWSENWASVEVWALDGDFHPSGQRTVVSSSCIGISGIFGLLGSTGITLCCVGSHLGLGWWFLRSRGKRRLAADLELIESWGGGMGAEQMFDLGMMKPPQTPEWRRSSTGDE
ncbi:MAG: hypothetical protein Ct9H90mP16_07550 [Candidatus Poseidoniales archaeon]|nr:MAG: hypothetical protein Ct9H90mP16_07550 [Candidatus Poseidoniales archaeon]